MPSAPRYILYKMNLDQVFAGEVEYQKAGCPVIRANFYMATISVLKHNPDIKIQNQRLLKKWQI